MVDILLPESAINVLPLSPEPLLQWKGKTDVRKFIDYLYVDIYPPFSSYLYKREKKTMWRWSKRFAKGAREIPEDLKEELKERMLAQTVKIPNFLEDAIFG